MKPERKYDPFKQGFPNGLLYHYTSQDGIKGIVGERKIWATDIEYLNDNSELKHGTKYVMEAYEARKEEGKEDERPFFESVESLPPEIIDPDIYVISMCEKRDLLSQWRGYTESNNGFSIGFDPRALEEIAMQINHMILVRCLYDEEEKQKLNKLFLDACIEEWITASQVKGKGQKEKELTVAKTFARGWKIVAAAMKHESYKEEHEWRLVGDCQPGQPLKFRNGKSALTPYFEMKWGKGSHVPGIQPIRSIIIGPCPNPDLSEKSVEKLLEANGVTGVGVTCSGIPYRSW